MGSTVRGPRHCTIYRVPGNSGSNWRLLMEKGRRYEKLGRARVPRKLRGPYADYSALERVDHNCKMTSLHLYWGDVLVWGERMMMLYRPACGFVCAHDLFRGSPLGVHERLERLCELLAVENSPEGRYDPEEDGLVQAVTDSDVQRALDFFGLDTKASE